MMKRFVVGLSVCMLALGMAGCPKPSKKKQNQKTTKRTVTKSKTLVIYSGRSKKLVKPIIEMFTKDTGIKVKVKFGKTAQLALLLNEEIKQKKVSADLFWSQDAGALGLLEQAGAFAKIDDKLIKKTPSFLQNKSGLWVATSGRARVIAYAPKKVKKDDIPKSVFDLTKPKYKGKVGWAPTNASFQAFVTAMRVSAGEAKTKAWLEGMKKNGAKSYPKNTAIVKAIAAGEVVYGLPNHYYLLRFKTKDANYPIAQTFFAKRDIGNLVNIAGAGLLKGGKNAANAKTFLTYLLSKKAQEYVTQKAFEYPMIEEVKANKLLLPLKDLLNTAPTVELNKLRDLKGTLKLLTSVGLP